MSRLVILSDRQRKAGHAYDFLVRRGGVGTGMVVFEGDETDHREEYRHLPDWYACTIDHEALELLRRHRGLYGDRIRAAGVPPPTPGGVWVSRMVVIRVTNTVLDELKRRRLPAKKPVRSLTPMVRMLREMREARAAAPNAAFKRLIREVVTSKPILTGLKISEEALNMLQQTAEAEVGDMFEDAVLKMMRSERRPQMSADLFQAVVSDRRAPGAKLSAPKSTPLETAVSRDRSPTTDHRIKEEPTDPTD